MALSAAPLPVAEAGRWAVLASCGAVVTFVGTARDHSAGRSDVRELDYEAYEPYATDRLHRVAAEVRRRWPIVGRVALLHRTGVVGLTEAAVVVAVSAPHRHEAFDAARFAIDELKSTVPLWKQERGPAGATWSEPCSQIGLASTGREAER